MPLRFNTPDRLCGGEEGGVEGGGCGRGGPQALEDGFEAGQVGHHTSSTRDLWVGAQGGKFT